MRRVFDTMIAVVLIALVSVLIPLSLCCIPAFGRYTFFPLLTKLINHFTSAYVLPCLQVELLFGSFNVRGRGQEIRETLRGVTVSLFKVQLQPSFLEGLALEKKGTAPVRVSDVVIRELSLHLGSSWRVVIDINNVDVHTQMVNPNEENLIELKDAVGMKVYEAFGWIYRFSGQKNKEEQDKEAAALPENKKKFGLKDRVMQLVVAQIDIQMRDFNVVVDALSLGLQRKEATRVRVGMKECEVLSGIVHENIDEGRELILTSSDIRESHKIRIDNFVISSGPTTEEWKGTPAEDDPSIVKLVDMPFFELNVEVPPMARVLGLVPSYFPIGFDKRVCDVELLLPAGSRHTIEKDAFVRVLQDAYVPYLDYYVAVKTARNIEAEHVACNPASADEMNYYVDTFKKVETDTKLAAAEKATLQEKLLEIEGKLTVSDLVKLRMQSLGLDVYFRGENCTGLGLDECIALGNELSAKPENIMFGKMQVALCVNSFVVEFQEARRQLAEFTLNEFGVNVDQYAIAIGDEKLFRSVEMSLEQVIFAVMPSVISTIGPHESPSSKIMYADFTRITPSSDITTRPLQIVMKVKQFQSGRQEVASIMRGIQIVATAYELECFLLYADLLNTDVGQALAAAKPMPTLSPIDEAAMTQVLSAQSVESASETLAPFAVLGGREMDFDLLLDGCRLIMLPAQSFAIYADLDYDSAMEHTEKHGMGKSRIEIPACLNISISSAKQKESVKLEVTKIGIIARYIDQDETEDSDADQLLTPTAFSIAHELTVDELNPLINRQKVSVKMPDVVISFSDLSLALVSSCTNALSSIQTTTPEHAQLRLETRLKQKELQRQAKLDAILERIRRMFDEIDEDKNGHIELSELLMLLRRVNVANSLLERELEYFVRVLFKEIDRDGNGFIEFDELRVYLRDDLMNDGIASGEGTGSGELDGSLNLRGGEYLTTDEFEKLSGGVKPTSRDHMQEIIMQPFFKGRFFDLYESETHATNASLNGQRPIDVQKKLVRLIGNYDAAQISWEKLVNPELPAEDKSEWLLHMSTHCGGISEYQSAAKVIARQKKDSIFATALREAEEKMLKDYSAPSVKKQLLLTTDLKLGNLRIVLTDPELPIQLSRGYFAIQNVKLSVDMKAGDIGVSGPVDWFVVATSGASEWTALFGVRIVAMCYSDLANAMEDVIEPWELVAGLSSSIGENGVAVLVEAAKRFQINVTPGLLKMYRAMNDVLAGENARTSWKQHQEAFRSGLASRSQQNTECVIQNSTGANLTFVVNGERFEIRSEQRSSLNLPLSPDGTGAIDSVEIENWGKSKESTVLPSFGVKNIRVESDLSDGVTLFVSAYCRLEDPLRQRIVLKSNLYLCNHSSRDCEIKFLTLGKEGTPSSTSEVIVLPPHERATLPLSALMGITEVYGRPAGYNDWIVKANLNDDLVTGTAAVQDIDEQEKAMKARLTQRRGTMVFGVSQENNSKIVKQLAPGVILRRWHLRTHFEWEISVLPPFVVRNSLPYTLEFRFVEYKVKESKNPAAAYELVEASLKAENDKGSSDVIGGVVSSGHDAEVTGISLFAPGYLSVRLLAKENEDGSPCDKTKWSKPLLMAIHAGVEQFSIGREAVDLEGVTVSLDRLTLPNLPRLVRFSSPYWIVNNTSVDVSIASAAPGAKKASFEAMASSRGFEYPRLAQLEHDRLSIKPVGMLGTRPAGWSALGKVPESAYTSNPLSDTAFNAATWSEPMNSTTVNTIGELNCGPNVFGVKIEGLYGSFEQSIALTLTPRFYVQNRLKEKVFLQTFVTSENAEDADEIFRTKRTVEDAQASISSVITGDSTPLYHFFALKKGESLVQSQKYVSLSFSDKPDNSWSHVIPISTAGDTYVQLYSPVLERHIICLASVQVIDMYVYLILSDTSGSPPYRIENFTPYKIDCSEIAETSLFKADETESERSVKNGQWHAFAWSNSLAKAHKMQIRLEHPDGRFAEKKYDIDSVGYHESLVLEDTIGVDENKIERVEIIVQTVVDEGTRVLKFVGKELEMSRLENQEAQFEHEFEQRKMIFASSFDIRFSGFGLSLFDAFPQEVFFMSVDIIQIQKIPSSLEWVFSVFHSQIDNMLPTAKFPVVLNPLNSGFSDKTPGKPPKPLMKFALDADLAAKIGIYRLLEFQLNSLGLKVDLDYIVNLVKLVEPFLASDTAMIIASNATLDRVLHRQVPALPTTQLTADGNIRHNVLYFDLLRIGALSVDLEYSITRKDIVSNAGGSNSVVFGLLTQVIGLIGSNLSGSPSLNFSEIVIHRCFSTKDRLQSQLIQNFVRQAVMQAYRLIGSADIIGDPIGLVEDLGSGVVEFFKITKDELTGDSQTRGEGVKVLGKTVAQTGASTLAKITGSLDKFVGDFAQESDSDEDAVASEEVGSPSSGLKFAKDLGKGLTGIFTKPVEGAKKRGVTGLLQGTVQGIAGPGVVLLKQITSTTHTIALGVQSTVVDRSPFGGRRRLAKKVDGNRVVADFDETHYRPTRLFIEVVSAQGLLCDDSCDPMCVVRIDEKPVLKTNILYNTLNPVWQEKNQVELTGKEQEVQFVVKDSYGGAIEKTIGKCIVPMDELHDDFRPPQYSSSLDEWVKTGIKPEETKKNVSNVVKQKEYTLYARNETTKGAAAAVGTASAFFGLGSNAKVKLSEDDVHVLVTVLELRDLRGVNSNVDPFVAVHIGKTVQRTHAAKVSFVSTDGVQVGSALWKNELFTFPVIRKTAGDSPEIQISLKDKRILQDDTLGYGSVPLVLKPTKQPLEHEMEVHKGKNGAGDIVGYVKLKVEVIGATASGLALASTFDPKAKGDASPNMSLNSFKLGPDAVKAGKICVSCEFE